MEKFPNQTCFQCDPGPGERNGPEVTSEELQDHIEKMIEEYIDQNIQDEKDEFYEEDD